MSRAQLGEDCRVHQSRHLEQLPGSYVLVRDGELGRAEAALRAAGHSLALL
jgi:hypothetical protein